MITKLGDNISKIYVIFLSFKRSLMGGFFLLLTECY